MENPHEPLWKIADVAEATKTPLNTLRSWVARGFFPVEAQGPDAGKTAPRFMTGYSALAVAVTAELLRIGVPISVAVKAGRKFADYGDVPGGWVGSAGEVSVDKGLASRDPGGLFEGENVLDTAIIVDADGKVSIRPVKSDTCAINLLPDGPVIVCLLEAVVRGFEQELDRIAHSSRIPLSELQAAASRMGFDLVPKKEDGE